VRATLRPIPCPEARFPKFRRQKIAGPDLRPSYIRQRATVAQAARPPILASTGPTSRSGGGVGLALLEHFKRFHGCPSDGAVLSGGVVGALEGD